MNNLFYVIAVGLPVWLIMVVLGRQLRQRWAVRMGAPYHLICIANAVLATSYFIFDLEVLAQRDKHRVIMAAAFMMDALLLLNLFNRFYWEEYFAKKRKMIVPRFFTHATRIVGITAAVVLILQFVFDVRVPGLIASIGGLSLAVGLALRPVISNLTAGLTIQMSKPLKQGDWLLVDNRLAEVMELNWRSTRLRTVDHTYFEVPNVDFVNGHIQNYSYPTPQHAMRVTVPVDYSAPPNKVRRILLRATADVEGVLKEPAPEVFLKDFGESGVLYEIKFWIDRDEKQDNIADGIRTDAWYELRRAGISIPLPQRVVRYERPADDNETQLKQISAMLGKNMIFGVLSEDQRNKLVVGAHTQLFGKGERIFRQGRRAARSTSSWTARPTYSSSRTAWTPGSTWCTAVTASVKSPCSPAKNSAPPSWPRATARSSWSPANAWPKCSASLPNWWKVSVKSSPSAALRPRSSSRNPNHNVSATTCP